LPPARRRRPRTATWTFVGTVAIGIAAVAGAALGARRPGPPGRETLHRVSVAPPAEPTPSEVLVEAAPDRSALAPRGPREESPFSVSPAPSAAHAPRVAPASPPAARGHNTSSHAPIDRPLYL
jgi:hypothetical protein